MVRLQKNIRVLALSLILLGCMASSNPSVLSGIIIEVVTNFERLERRTPRVPEVRNSWLYEQGVRSKYAVLKDIAGIKLLEAAVGEPVFIKGPHTDSIHYYASSIGYYNPRFINNTSQTLKQLFENKQFVGVAQKLYDTRFKTLLRTFYSAYQELHYAKNTENLAALKKQYVQYLNTNTVPQSYLHNLFWETGWSMDALNYSGYEYTMALGFWLRRNIDGTDHLFFELLELVLHQFDPQHIDINTYSGSWTNGYELFELADYSQGTMVFLGGTLHEGGTSFRLSHTSNSSITAIPGLAGWYYFPQGSYTVSVFSYNGQEVLLFRNTEKELIGWLKKLKPEEDFLEYVLANKTKHQLAGRYQRENTKKEIIFYSSDKRVKGLAATEKYDFAMSLEEYPTDIIYFSNNASFAYEKTSRGLDLYKTNYSDEWWKTEERIASLRKIGPPVSSSTDKIPGEYPFTSQEILSYEIKDYYTLAELRIMRNEIYARYGYQFSSKDLLNHFAGKKWYVPNSKAVLDFMSPIEKLNIEIITRLEQVKKKEEKEELDEE